VALFAVFLWSQDPRQLVASLATVEPIWIAPAVAVYFIGVWLRAARWRLLMSPFAAVRTERLFRIILIGFAVNNVLPLRLGELVRTFLLRQSHGVPIASALATVLIERLLDVFALCGILTAVLIWAQPRGWLLAAAGTAAMITAGGVVGLLIVLVLPRSVLERLFAFGVGIAGRVHRRLGNLAASIVDGLRVLEDGRALLGIVSLSILCWAAELGLYYFLALSLSVDAGMLGLAAGMVIANLATVLPSPPGYVGTFDIALQLTLTESFGVPEAKAGAFTLLTHAVLLVPVVVAGLVLLSWEDLSFRSLTRGRVERRDAGEDATMAQSTPSTQAPSGSDFR
jgi:glycosyltransferase 2 family protein